MNILFSKTNLITIDINSWHTQTAKLIWQCKIVTWVEIAFILLHAPIFRFRCLFVWHRFGCFIYILHTHTHTLFYCTLSKFTITNINSLLLFFFLLLRVCAWLFVFLFHFIAMEMENGEYVAFKCIIAVLFSMCNTTYTSNRISFGYSFFLFTEEWVLIFSLFELYTVM